MKTAKEILEKNANALARQSWTSTTLTGNTQSADPARAKEISQNTKTLINMVFTRFMAIYGHKFKSSFETEAEMRIAKREWAMSLANYSENELVAAVSVAKESLAWAPSISEFLDILRNLNDVFGLPDVRAAYKEASFYAHCPSRHQWSHNVIYHAGRATGWFELRTETEKQTFPLFSYNFDIMCQRFRQGDTLDQPVHLAVEDKQTNTLFSFIEQWSTDNGLTQEVGSSLLYFMTKPQGSRARANFRTKAQGRLADMSLTLTLPE